ncbi:fibronectin type III domain-containing protein [Actinoplanes awajinensis]|nr:fibronectin type III domain-containing protein [Actinoplanes awajinensis]
MLGIRKATAVILPMIAGPLLLAACASTPAPQAAPSPSGTAWLLIATGSVTPSPTVTFAPRATSAAVTLSPTTSPSPTPRPSGTSCNPGTYLGGAINGMTVTTSKTTAVVKWYNPGGRTLVQYRIIAVSEDLVTGPQPEVPGWITVTPTGCGWMTATVTGLTPATPYVFSVDGVWTREGLDGTYAATVARSRVTSTA